MPTNEFSSWSPGLFFLLLLLPHLPSGRKELVLRPKQGRRIRVGEAPTPRRGQERDSTASWDQNPTGMETSSHTQAGGRDGAGILCTEGMFSASPGPARGKDWMPLRGSLVHQGHQTTASIHPSRLEMAERGAALVCSTCREAGEKPEAPRPVPAPCPIPHGTGRWCWEGGRGHPDRGGLE